MSSNRTLYGQVSAVAPYSDTITKLKVNFTPTQSGTPWKDDTVNNAPYVFRSVPMGNREWNKLVGGTVAWNQLIPNANKDFTNTITDTRTMVNFRIRLGVSPYTSFAAKDIQTAGTYNFLFNASASGPFNMVHNGSVNNFVFLPTGVGNYVQGHKYFASITFTGVNVQTVGGCASTNLMMSDLTLALGPTLADYVYSLEQSQAGSGIAWLKMYDLIDDQYHAYSQGSLESVNVSAHVMRDADNNIIETYPTDSSVTLRGMLKTDADGNLYYDGDEYLPDGAVKRYWGERAYQSGDASDGSTMITDGTNTVYKLTTPTTETATPFTMWQVCDPDGTEEWTDYGVAQGTRDYAVPVGHESTYAMAYPIEGVDSFTVTANDGTTHTYPVTLSEEIYRGYVDMLTGEAVSDMASIAEYNGETISEPWLSSLDVYSAGATPTNGAQVVYPITPEEVTATITGDPTELGEVTSVTSTKGTVQWGNMMSLGLKAEITIDSPF